MLTTEAICSLALIVQSLRDSQFTPEGARWAYEQIPAEDKTLVWLERSGHNIAIDVEREEVFAQVHGLITRVASIDLPKGRPTVQKGMAEPVQSSNGPPLAVCPKHIRRKMFLGKDGLEPREAL